ncbi:MAG: hypothetical protein K8T89_14020 [Planctomycetes bacterium]|nr:hypothetical protein [Planctomycetota bacterium]
MAFDVEELKFCGMIASVAEKEVSASINDDEDRTFRLSIYQQYLAAGNPKNKREWIKQEFKKHFLFVTRPPVWIERTTVPRWPFFQGKPMVFIEQLTVPENDVSRLTVSPDVVLYVFGSRKPVSDVPGGWESVYRVIEQVRDL